MNNVRIFGHYSLRLKGIIVYVHAHKAISTLNLNSCLEVVPVNLGGLSFTATVAWALSHTFPIDFYLVFQFHKFIFSPIKKYYMYLHETTISESLDKFMFT